MGDDLMPKDSLPPPAGASRFAPIIERSPLPMIEVEGRDHIVWFVNAAFCALLGKPREELMGRPFESLVGNGRECVAVLDRVYATGEAETHAERDVTNPAPAYWLYAMCPAVDAGRAAERVVIQLTRATHFRQNAAAMNEALLLGGLRQHELREAAEKANASMLVEIGERRRVELELQTAQAQLRANAAELERLVVERTAQLRASVGELEVFAYSLAHDLRAPVRAIRGFTQMVLELPPDQVCPAAVPLLNRVVTAATRMDSLIQDVLALSTAIRRPVTLAAIDLDALVGDLVQERPEFAAPRVEMIIERPLRPVVGHEALLSQCVANLLGNAVKFVNPGTVPRVRVRTEERIDPVASARPVVRIWIEDEGIGIPAEAQERIFDIFQRLHAASQYHGSGIGLAIVRKAIERMGGRVGVESALNEGSRFWLDLPKG